MSVGTPPIREHGLGDICHLRLTTSASVDEFGRVRVSRHLDLVGSTPFPNGVAVQVYRTQHA
jgi:hypothetical protein